MTATILNVDDTEAIRYAKSRALTRAGFTVVEAATGRDALRLVDEVVPDLVMLDVKLPDMSGLDVCRIIKEARPQMLVLQVSASFVQRGDRVRGLKNGADSYLTEPVEPEELIASVGALLRLRRAEDALAGTERRWQATFDVLRDGVCLLDEQGVVVSANAALGRLMGRRPADLIGQRAPLLWPQALDLGAPGRAAVGFALGDRWVRASIDPLPREGDRPGGFVGVFADITDRHQAETELQGLNRQLEQEVTRSTSELAQSAELLQSEKRSREQVEAALRQAQKMEAVGQLTGGIAHDFNNLLTGIISNLELVKRNITDIAPDIAGFVAQAMDSASRGASLTQRLLAFSRQQNLDPRPADLNEVVDNLAELANRTVGDEVRVETALSAVPVPACCDVNQLESALLNLVVNARDAMPSGGMIILKTGLAELADAADTRTEFVTVAVVDSGTGMAPEVLERAFDPFFTTKPVGRGTGLGLSQVYGFAMQSGGHVRIASEPGQGTTVSLYLPRHRGALPQPATAPAPRQAIPPGAGERLLVVEDDPIVRLSLVRTLEDLNYQIVEAASPADALARIASAGELRLMITDVGLPGMSGRDLAKAVRAQRPDLKVLFVTGYAEGAPQRGGAMAKGEFALAKPFTTARLAQQVRAVLDGPAL